MQLKFHAKPGALCPWPNSHFGGQPRRYIGRRFVAPETKMVDGKTVVVKPAGYPANDEPDVLDANDADAADMIRYCRKGNTWPADAETAAACGVDFVALKKGEDGEWFAAPKPAASGGNKPAKKD